MIRRNTNQRQIVFEAIDYLGHSSSEQLIEYIGKNYSDISLATIYRNITILIDECKIRKVRLRGIDVYETVKVKHYHFICRSCGSITDITPTEAGVDFECIKKIAGNEIDECEVSFYGMCQDCKNKTII